MSKFKIDVGWQIETNRADELLAVRVGREPLIKMLRAMHHSWLRRAEAEHRPNLGGVLIETREAKLMVSACDGHRAARSELQVVEPPTAHVGIVQGRFVAALVGALLLQEAAEASLSIGPDNFDLRCGDLRASCPTIKAKYPDIDRVIIEPRHVMTFRRRDMLAALRIIQWANPEDAEKESAQAHWACSWKRMSIGVLVRESSLSLAPRNSMNLEDGPPVVEIDCIAPVAGMFAFCGRYMKQALRSFPAETIQLGYAPQSSDTGFDPLIIRSVEAPGEIRVIMPMRLHIRTK